MKEQEKIRKGQGSSSLKEGKGLKSTKSVRRNGRFQQKIFQNGKLRKIGRIEDGGQPKIK